MSRQLTPPKMNTETTDAVNGQPPVTTHLNGYSSHKADANGFKISKKFSPRENNPKRVSPSQVKIINVSPRSTSSMDQSESGEGISEILEEFGSKTSLHGIPYILGHHQNFNKCRWKNKFYAAIILICIAIATWTSYEILNDILGYPLTTEVIREQRSSAEFPALTLCNINPYKTPDPGAGQGFEFGAWVSSTCRALVYF